jgi:diguanylate cyclase (GGDEF)-like protein
MVERGGADPGSEVSDARLGQALAALKGGQLSLARDEASQAFDLAAAAGEASVAARAALIAAKACANMSATDDALAWASHAAARAADARLGHVEAAARVIQAWSLAVNDRVEGSIEALTRALSLVDESTPGESRRTIFTGVALTYQELGLTHLAYAAAERALDAEGASGQVIDRVRARVNLLFVGVEEFDTLTRVDAAAAARLMAQLLAHVEPLGTDAELARTPMARAGYCHAVGRLYGRVGRHAEAVALLEELVAAPPEGVPDALTREAWIDLADVLYRAGDTRRGRECVERASPSGTTHVTSRRDLPRLSRLAQWRGDATTACEYLALFHARTIRAWRTLLEVRVRELTTQLTDQAARLELAELRERHAGLERRVDDMAVIASIDSLTGVLTRRAFAAEFDRASRDAKNLALLMLDIDRFKSVNDEHSHLVGDRVLQRVGAIVASGLRGPDRIGRYGGEEFVVLLDGVDRAVAASVAERLRRSVETGDWAAVAPGLSITVSIGVAARGAAGGAAEGAAMGLEDLLARADAQLYRAKRGGRNRVCVDGE